MSKCRQWALWVSAGSLVTACQLGLDGRACGVSDSGQANVCLEGWSCCSENVCQQDCSTPASPSPSGGPGSGADAEMKAAAAGAPARSVRASIGPLGGELRLGEARASVPAGALTETTDLELEAIELPEALPAARTQTSRVYSLATPDTTFAEPVTLEVPVDAGPHQFLQVLELDGDWQTVPASYGVSESATDSEGSPLPVVRWSTRHGGIFVVVIVEYQMSFDLFLDGTHYRHACDLGRGGILQSDPNGGAGPVLDTESSSANFSSECPWPAYEPRLWLSAMLRGFLPSQGPATGEWDLSAPETVLPLRVEFIASSPVETPVNDDPPFQTYDSTVPVDGASDPTLPMTQDGFRESPVAAGRVRVSRVPTVEGVGQSAFYEGGETSGLYVIELTDVTLGASGPSAPSPNAPFPPTVTIASATLTAAF